MVSAGIDERRRDPELASRLMLELRSKELVELVPDVLSSRITEELLIGNEPGLLLRSESFDDGFESVVLDVDARGKEPDSVRDVRALWILLAARAERVSFERVAILLPRFPEPKVYERFELLGIPLLVRFVPLLRELLPVLAPR